MTFIRAKACRRSTTTPQLNCSWQSARRVVATKYRRFATAAEAIRYAVEDLRTPRAFGAWLEVGDERFNSGEIQRLYEAVIIRCASLSDRAPRAHDFATRLMGPPPRGNSLEKRPPLPDFKKTSKGQRLRITSALRVERAEIAPVLFVAPVIGFTNAALFPKLLYPFNDPKIAHRAIAECFQGFRVCGAVVSSSRLFQARKFSNDGTSLSPCSRATAALPRARIRAPNGITAGSASSA